MTSLETQVAELAAGLAVVQRDWRRMRADIEAMDPEAKSYLRHVSRRRLALLDLLVKLYGLPE